MLIRIGQDFPARDSLQWSTTGYWRHDRSTGRVDGHGATVREDTWYRLELRRGNTGADRGSAICYGRSCIRGWEIPRVDVCYLFGNILAE